ncbi:unnamed protein product, partial [Angiostrongylus costaricensis]|uniref:Protein kinase domain-containing protein n=1 Tax=Angiostrongylus costaricensis TaxID=334426 RepID=A0A158PL29_ANGCS
IHPGRTRSGRNVAVKRARDEKEIRAAQKEVEFYRRCAGARNIVQYLGCEHRKATNHSPERFSFAMERALFSLDKLMKRVRNLQGLPKEIIVDLLYDSVFALLTLKDRGIAHRDIKHLNILVFPGPKKGRRSQYLFKFCDMGVSSFVDDDGMMQTLVGTPNVLCPPLAFAHAQRSPRSRDHYTREQCDLWSLGCTVYFVSTGKFPFPVDPKDPNVYAQAVANCLYECCSYYGNRTLLDYRRYLRWFRHCLKRLIAMLFSPEPTLETLREMVKSMQESSEKRYISIESVEIYNYCDLRAIPSFR